jgi:hypothetical protein
MASTRQMKVFSVRPIYAWIMRRDRDGMAGVLDVKRQDYERILYHALVSSLLHTCSSSLLRVARIESRRAVIRETLYGVQMVDMDILPA